MSAATTAASVAGVYAAALLQVAGERGTTNGVLEACRSLPVALTREVIDLLDHPATARAQAKAALAASLPEAPREIRDLLQLLVDRHRLADAPAIFKEAVRQAELAGGAVAVEVLTAAPLGGEATVKVSAALLRVFGANAQIQVGVDASLLGGLTVRSGDTLIDGSVRRSIAEMKAALLAAPVGVALWSAELP